MFFSACREVARELTNVPRRTLSIGIIIDYTALRDIKNTILKFEKKGLD